MVIVMLVDKRMKEKGGLRKKLEVLKGVLNWGWSQKVVYTVGSYVLLVPWIEYAKSCLRRKLTVSCR